jgi:hypothetical protein
VNRRQFTFQEVRTVGVEEKYLERNSPRIILCFGQLREKFLRKDMRDKDQMIEIKYWQNNF